MHNIITGCILFLNLIIYGVNYMDFEEAVKRMDRRNKKEITWTLSDRIIRYRYIDGLNARNWDGSLAPNPGTTALEKNGLEVRR